MAKITDFSGYTGPVGVSLRTKQSKHGRYLATCHMGYGHGVAQFELDCASRTVTCKHCGELVDPFDVLLTLSEEERWFLWGRNEYLAAKEEFEAIKAEWSLTTTEKRRLQQARKRARFKNPYNDEPAE